ncbi:MAG: cupin domain-containing protein [Nitrospina sp.]|jgi:quercetin dioxygenase-like cupin family protein|nr:cupin domain-containing protein [Nitrospina sp.]
MKHVFDVNNLDGMPAFSPPHHTKTIDKKLVYEETGARNLAIWHGEIEQDGVAELHVHEAMEQAFYVLDGEAKFRIGGEEQKVGEGNLVFIPRNTSHEITSVGDTELKILIVMTPPPSSAGAWKKQ